MLTCVINKEYVPNEQDYAFRSFAFNRAQLDVAWHSHPEFELTWIASGSGQRMVGDQLEPFVDGDLVLIGPDIPHTWRAEKCDKPYKGICVQFRGQWVRRLLGCVQGRDAIEALLAEATQRGLVFPVQHITEHIVEGADSSRVAHLLIILEQLAAAQNAGLSRPLTAEGYMAPAVPQVAHRRLADICQWLIAHCDQPCHVEDVARRFGMSVSTLSRVFSRELKKPYSHYLQEYA